MYDFYCENCRNLKELLRPIGDRNVLLVCSTCGGDRYRTVSAPNLSIWNPTRKFPNLRKEGDGAMTFDNRIQYEGYLKDNGIFEWKTEGLKASKPGQTVLMTDSKDRSLKSEERVAPGRAEV